MTGACRHSSTDSSGGRARAARTLRWAGVDERTIMRLGGWKTPAMFDRYAIVDDADVVETQATLDRAHPGRSSVSQHVMTVGVTCLLQGKGATS
jgi:hypothetical protein